MAFDSPVRLANVCRTISDDSVATYVDEFDGVALSGDWSHEGWTLNGEASVGLPLVASGIAKTNTSIELRSAALADQSPSLTALRECTVYIGPMNPNTAVYILMDMDETTPATTGSVFARFFKNSAGFRSIALFVNNAVVASTTATNAAHAYVARLSIDANSVIRVYWKSTTVPDITYSAAGYTAAGGLTGFALEENEVAAIASISWFRFSYFPSVGGLPQRCLVASAGGLVYRENTAGGMTDVTTALTLASDRLLSSTPYLQKLYIADYAKKASGNNAALTFSSPNGTLTDAAGDFVTNGVSTDDDWLEILSEGNGTAGVYLITARTATTITFTGDGGTHASGVKYRVCRAPKVFDSSDLTLTKMPIGTIGNQPPLGCTIVATWMEKLVWTADPDYPHIAYLSKSGDPNDYAYVADIADLEPGQAFVYDPARTAGAGSIGDSVKAVIPHSDNYIIFAGYRTVSIQRGDPTYNGTLDLVTRDIGIVDKQAWSYTPEGVICGLSPDGIYLFFPGPNANPRRESRIRLPQELVNIDTDAYDVMAAYDIRRQGVRFFVTPKTIGPTTHWFLDWEKKAFYADTLPPEMDPTAICQHSIGGDRTPTIVLGCRDGFLRVADEETDNDDGTDFDSNATLGPFTLGHPGFEGIIHEVFTELARQSGPILVEIMVGDSPEQAFNSEPILSFSCAAGVNPPELVRLRGGCCFIRVSSEDNTAWAIEAQMIEREIVGRLRQ